jgi:hypothetical protein
MASGKIKDPFSNSGSSGITRGLPGITGADTTTTQLLAQTAQDVVQHLSNLNTGLAGWSALQQQQASAVLENTVALEQNTQNRDGKMAGTIASAAESVLGGGGLLTPILSGIMSLLGGSTTSESLAAPQPFSLPAPIAVQATVSSNAGSVAPPAPSTPAMGGRAGGGSVIVQVNAMDSRSFLDHKDEIAQAVREAVLHSHGLNDVFSEL